MNSEVTTCILPPDPREPKHRYLVLALMIVILICQLGLTAGVAKLILSLK